MKKEMKWFGVMIGTGLVLVTGALSIRAYKESEAEKIAAYNARQAEIIQEAEIRWSGPCHDVVFNLHDWGTPSKITCPNRNHQIKPMAATVLCECKAASSNASLK